MEYITLPLIVGGITLFLAIIIIIMWSNRHKDFINKAQMIKVGMNQESVLQIMGEPTSTEEYEGKRVLIWEKSQWKGIQNGGTLTRGVKITLKNNIVESVSFKNLDKSTFW